MAGRGNGWSGLFAATFKRSRNPMALLDEGRHHVDVNGAYLRLVGYRRDEIIGRPIYELVPGGRPQMSPAEWAKALAAGEFTGEAQALSADGTHIAVQWAAHTENVTGQRLVLFVALSTSRWGRRFRRAVTSEPEPGTLSEREREIVGHVARGSSGPEIADELGIAHDTVRTHVRNAMTKVGARSRAELVAKSLGDGLVLH